MQITLPVAVLAGLVSFASPCFLPIVPAYVGQLVGSGDGRVDRRAALGNSLSFVAGFSIVFIALWAALGLIGHSLGPYAEYARIVAGAVLVLMGLHVAGLLSIPVLDRLVRARGPANGASPLRAGLMGVVFAAGWTPCIGPVLGGILALATVSSTAWSGAALMVGYCAGLGLPIIAVALGSAQATARLSWFRRHHVVISLVSGGILVVIGMLMITNMFPRLAGWLPTVEI
ncbi:cytochrome c biogenesis CcdA family protein [Actinomyces slackii]|uniref:Thiol:disulfide interchange protein n=1 Tax=Actinomyces slackii TaxID=52774 RepID=A0A448K9L2_9ACTO|nr:cytochrome c biogenesis CcdA family protein [Actinomyces slackii]VEG73560.1 thiol:disulfide interchange protein precursor [Actinomyces slackii]